MAHWYAYQSYIVVVLTIHYRTFRAVANSDKIESYFSLKG